MRTIVNSNEIHVNASTISQRRAKAELIRNPVKAFLNDALAKEPDQEDYETSEDMYEAYSRFGNSHKLYLLGSDTFSESLRKDHGLKKERITIDKKRKTVWRCKLVKWKDPDDPSQMTLTTEEEEEGEEQAVPTENN
jgi:hypothetical protein